MSSLENVYHWINYPVSLFFRLSCFLGLYKPRKQHHQAVQIIAKQTGPTPLPHSAASSTRLTPAVTSVARLPKTKESTSVSRPSKLPVASRKRRHSTIKATNIPIRRSPRSQPPPTSSTATMTPETPSAPPSVTIPTISIPKQDTVPPPSMTNLAALLGMTPPLPGEVHSHPNMPNWIQEIYNRLQIHNTQLKANEAKLAQTAALLKRNQELQLALNQANLKIAQLEAQANQPTPSTPPSTAQWATMAAKPPMDDSRKEPPKPQTSTDPTLPSTSKAPPRPKVPSKRPLTLAQVSRFYSDPCTNPGYQFLHFTARGRERISEVRAGFSLLGLSQSRILDIHYPSNNTISFLVHNDYAKTVIEAMAQLPASKQIKDFNPCDPKVLRDPKYAGNTDPHFLKAEAVRIHQQRLARIVQRLPVHHLQLAVAREFCFTHKWISEAMYQALYFDIYPDKAPKRTSPSSSEAVPMTGVHESSPIS